MALFNIYNLEQIARNRFRLDERWTNESSLLDEVLASYSRFSFEKEYDIFLSHSYKDRLAVAGLVQHLIDQYGYEVYVDWIEDKNLDHSNVTKENAKTLKSRMKKCKCLLYVTSDNTSSSKWMPWELGLMDGLKEMVAICPLTREYKSADNYLGQEYLGLYPYITETTTNRNQQALWVNYDSNHDVLFDRWLKG